MAVIAVCPVTVVTDLLLPRHTTDCSTALFVGRRMLDVQSTTDDTRVTLSLGVCVCVCVCV